MRYFAWTLTIDETSGLPGANCFDSLRRLGCEWGMMKATNNCNIVLCNYEINDEQLEIPRILLLLSRLAGSFRNALDLILFHYQTEGLLTAS